jgi:hypothetical protein
VPWNLPESDGELVKLAKGYPYPAPGGSYVFGDGVARPLTGDACVPALFDGRTPVIGHGSNRSPEQLARKFGSAATIPVSRAWLDDYDVVYSAHMTRYGAIAANLQHAPGTRVEVWVAWLTGDQLAFMHRTELGAEIYRYGSLRDAGIALEAGPSDRLEAAGVYLSTYGYLTQDGAPIPLAAVAAEGRAGPGLPQEAALALVRDRYRPGRQLEELILAKIRDPARRKALIAEMRAQAEPPHAPHFVPIEVVSDS